MNYTRTLAEYAVELKYKDLPKEVIEQAKLLTLQVLGVSLAACVTKQGNDAIALAKAMGGEYEEATIIGDGSKVSCVQAAFANGTLAKQDLRFPQFIYNLFRCVTFPYHLIPPFLLTSFF